MAGKEMINVVEYQTYYEISPNIKMFKSDIFNALQLRDMILEEYSDKNIKLDLANIEFLDSATIGVLLEIGKRFKKTGLKLYICNAYYAGSHLTELMNPQVFFAASEKEIMTLPKV